MALYLSISNLVGRYWYCGWIKSSMPLSKWRRSQQVLTIPLLTIPVFKGKGRDPLQKGNYRGISLTSVIARLPEFITLGHIQPLLEEMGAQTAYRKHTSCEDAIFAYLEAMSHYLLQDDQFMMCAFDLEKAFDSIEFSVLLNQCWDWWERVKAVKVMVYKANCMQVFIEMVTYVNLSRWREVFTKAQSCPPFCSL